ncbi:MAG: HEAT repeat domain-containing protein [Planctomycetes bacterium]|nr:HEAT repeat domain-containing protein [Planctomycetota bacterium]
MKRTLTLAFAALCFTTSMYAGDFKNSVSELGDPVKRPGAVAKLGEAGADAFDDLLEGLKTDVDAEKDAVKQGNLRQVRITCARLLGELRDSRATADLLKLLRDEKARASIDTSESCAIALGKIAASKPDAAGSADAVAEIRKLAADEKSGHKLRCAALTALAELKQGGEIALPLLKEDVDAAVRFAAVIVVGASKHAAAADALFAIWDQQFKDADTKKHSDALGIAALFALASFRDERSVQALINVATLPEFELNASYRDLAKGYLKEQSAKAIPILVEIFKDDTKGGSYAPTVRLLADFGPDGVRALVALAKLDANEIEANQLTLWDENRDGGVSLDEYKKKYAPTKAELDSEFAARDKNKNSKLEADEVDAAELTAWDVNKDGAVDAAEFSAGFKLGEAKLAEAFAKLDANKDSKLEHVVKYTSRVEGQLGLLMEDNALQAVMDAWRAMPAEDSGRKLLMRKLLLQRPRIALDLFREVAGDEKVEAAQRAQAIDAYAEVKGKDSFEDLKAWSDEKNPPEVRRAATRNLGREFVPLSKSEELLKLKTTDPDAETRMTALRGLQRSDKKENAEVFVKRLAEDSEASVRRAALEALEQFNNNAKLEGAGIYEPVKKAFNEDKDATVRAQALRLAVILAEQAGDNNATKYMVAKAISDSEMVVRTQVYTLMYRPNVKSQVDVKKLLEVVLRETEFQGRGDAVQALSYLDADKWADNTLDSKQLAAVVDLALSVLADRRSPFTVTLLGNFSSKGIQFTRISEKTVAMLKEALKGSAADFGRVASCLEVLTKVKVKDKDSFDLARQAAKLASYDARLAAVRFIQENGDKGDVAFLRELQNMGDATSSSMRHIIDEAIKTLEAR